MSVQPDTDRRPDEPGLFADLPAPSPKLVAQAQAKELAKRGAGAVRLLQPNRLQVELRASNLESLLPEDHRARLVWGYVELQDLSRLVEAVKARGSNAGRAAIDLRVLFALWLYATLEGVGSGREVARLTAAHDAYRWICGGVSVNYHALNDFRTSNEALMDELLTTNVAALAAAGAISLERVAQDGMRVRADAGAASFRRQASLDEHLNEAGELVHTLKAQAKADPGEGQRREQAARLRGAQEREERIKAARRRFTHRCPSPRSSSTNRASRWRRPRTNTSPSPSPSDSAAVAQWRERMARPEVREAYERRAATAECVNAQARNRGLLRMPVRGLAKMRSVVGLFVLAHNLLRAAVLAPHLVGWGIGASAMAAKAG